MKLCTAFLLALCATFLPVKATSVFDHVSRVNSEWNNPVFSVDAFRNERCDDALSERRLVQLHLQSVIRLLQSRSITGLSANQLQARVNNIALLVGYAEAGSFPRNITHRGRIPVFVDDRNVPCAVGYLMLLAGYTDFVGETRTNVNNIYIRQIKSDVFTKFHAESGLTLDELALIQPTYKDYNDYIAIVSIDRENDIQVAAFATDESRGLMYAYGKFSAINGILMNNLAVFNGTTWSAIPNEIKGKVTSMAVLNGELFVGGRFSMGNDSAIGLARYDGKSWHSFQADGEITCLKADSYYLYVGGKFTNIGGISAKYFAAYDGKTTTWNDRNAAFNAPVNAITVHVGNIIAGGEFTKNGNSDQLFLSEWNGIRWLSIVSPFNRPITAVHSGINRSVPTKQVLYVGSSRVNALDTAHHLVIAAKVDDDWEDLGKGIIWRMISNGGWHGHDENDSVLYVNGFENIEAPFNAVIARMQTSTAGHLLGMYHWLVDGNNDMLGFHQFGTKVPSAQYFKNNLYIGTEDKGLLKTDLVIFDKGEDNSVLLYPNPSVDEITVHLPTMAQYQVKIDIVDMLGKVVQSLSSDSGSFFTMQTSHLSQGAYYARITADGKSYTKKLLVSY